MRETINLLTSTIADGKHKDNNELVELLNKLKSIEEQSVQFDNEVIYEFLRTQLNEVGITSTRKAHEMKKQKQKLDSGLAYLNEASKVQSTMIKYIEKDLVNDNELVSSIEKLEEYLV